VTHIDPEKREEWERMLNEPIPGREPTPLQLEQEAEDFMSFMGMMGGR